MWVTIRYIMLLLLLLHLSQLTDSLQHLSLWNFISHCCFQLFLRLFKPFASQPNQKKIKTKISKNKISERFCLSPNDLVIWWWVHMHVCELCDFIVIMTMAIITLRVFTTSSLTASIFLNALPFKVQYIHTSILTYLCAWKCLRVFVWVFK